MSSPPDTVAVEQLTEEERERILQQAAEQYEMYAGDEIRKLLRLHDALRARVSELELLLRRDAQEPTRDYSHLQAQMLAEARVKELELARPPSCCVSGQHSFSWRQGIDACRYCGEPVRPPG